MEAAAQCALANNTTAADAAKSKKGSWC